MATLKQRRRSVYAKEMIKLKAKDRAYMNRRRLLINKIKKKIKAVKK